MSVVRHWKGCGCSLFKNIQGQAGYGFEQPGLVGGAPAYARGLELYGLKIPPNLKHSMIHRKQGDWFTHTEQFLSSTFLLATYRKLEAV